jgi:hypothetical protein
MIERRRCPCEGIGVSGRRRPIIHIGGYDVANTTAATPEAKPARKTPIRVLFENGIAVALIRAASEAAAIRFYTKKIYEAPIADQDALIKHGAQFPVDDASAEPE